MKILVSNDDGIFAHNLWVLAGELKNIAQVVVVAPDREQSAIGTAVTLHQILRMRKVRSLLPDVETYSVDGTPADSVILALNELVKGEVGLVVSGINQGLNLGDDVLISGTVGAALQGYLRNVPAIAVSTDAVDDPHLEKAAKLVVSLAKRIGDGALPSNIFLNVNVPNTASIEGISVTRLARGTHTDTTEEGKDSKGAYFRIVRQKLDKETSEKTDVWAIKQGYISITPLHAYLTSRPSAHALNGLALSAELFEELQKSEV